MPHSRGRFVQLGLPQGLLFPRASRRGVRRAESGLLFAAQDQGQSLDTELLKPTLRTGHMPAPAHPLFPPPREAPQLLWEG